MPDYEMKVHFDMNFSLGTQIEKFQAPNDEEAKRHARDCNKASGQYVSWLKRVQEIS